MSQYGVAVNNAVKMAVEDINAKGGILGGRKIEYIVTDEKGDSTEAVNAYNALMDQEIVALIGDVTSKPCKAVAAKAAADNMPMLTPSGTDADITKEGYASKSTDFKTQLTKIKGKNPDVLLIPVYYGDVALIVDQIQQQGITSKLLGADGWDGVASEVAKKSDDIKKLLNNAYFCSQYSASSTDPDLQAFLTKYKEKNGKEANMFAVLGYDSMQIMAAAIDKAGSTDSDKIIEALKATEYKGLTGTTKFDDQRNPVREAVITSFDNGAYKVIESYSMQ